MKIRNNRNIKTANTLLVKQFYKNHQKKGYHNTKLTDAQSKHTIRTHFKTKAYENYIPHEGKRIQDGNTALICSSIRT